MDNTNLLFNNFNKTETQNGGGALSSTGSKLVDLLAQGGALRGASESRIISLFMSAVAEDADKALKLLFYLRDAREGQGEKRFFRVCINYLAQKYPQTMINNLHFIPEMGRWDDLFYMLGNNRKLDNEIFAKIVKQIKIDLKAEFPSLLGKWLPSERAGKRSFGHYKTIVAGLYGAYNGQTSKNFRKEVLVPLRNKINIVEHKITTKAYSDIDYSKIPSLAMKGYAHLFYKYDGDRFEQYLEDVKSGKSKINASLLTPNDIVKSYFIDGHTTSAEYYDVAWQNLKEFRNDYNSNSLVVCDTSGSMTVNNYTPLSVAIGLSIYIAERNTGVFKNKFITFSNRPQLQEIVGDTITDKINSLNRSHWDMNTDIYKVFSVILQTAIANNIEPVDMVKSIYIISDMEFDSCNGRFKETVFETIEREYAERGYKMPHLVFWNVNASERQFPIDYRKNTTLISGYSPSHLQFAFNGAMSVINQICSKERYEKIKF